MSLQSVKSTINQNRNTSLLNLHTGFQRMSNKVFEVFSAIYFLDQGISFPVVMLVFAGSYIGRLFMRPTAVHIIYRYGLRRSVIFGTTFSAGLFLLYPMIDGVNGWLVLFSVYLAFQDIAYWLPYHAFYALAGENETRGKQLAIQGILINCMQVLVPLAGGILAHLVGFNALYTAALLAMLLAVVPLFYTTDIHPGAEINLRQAIRKIDLHGLFMAIGYGFYNNGGSMLWTIVIYLAVGNLVAFGGLITYELLVGTVLAWVVGHYIDKGHSKPIAITGIAILIISVLLQALWGTSVTHILIINAIIAFGTALFALPYWSATYNLAHNGISTLWYHFFAESGWDIGGAMACLLAAALFMAGGSVQHILLISICGLLFTLWPLSRVIDGRRNY